MSQKRDYYEVLCIEKTANGDEIRRSYRKLALKYHPDRNQGDAEAEVKFKEATEAFSILSDDEKKAQYDRFGHGGMGAGFDFDNAGMGDVFTHFQDMFSDFFGGFGGQGGQGGGRRGPARGQDIRVRGAIELKDALEGTKKEVHVRGAAPCESCAGTGGKDGAQPTTCPSCQGQGQVTTQRGFMMFSSACPQCQGSGQIIDNPCDECRGERYVEKRRKVLVSFPAGIDNGQRLRVPGQGMPGQPGAPAGDLYVDVEVADDERFERDGSDLGTRAPISFAQAALGGSVEVMLPNEDPVEVEFKAGTQPGSVHTIRGKGFPRLDRRARGDLHVLLEVEVPQKLSRKAKKLIKELQDELSA